MTFDKALYFQFTFANARSFIPMNFGQKDRPVIKASTGNSLALSPTSLSVELSQPSDLPNSGPNRKCLGVGDLSKDLKVHRGMVTNWASSVNDDLC